MVVRRFPAAEGHRGLLEALELVAAPELLVVDPMAPLDFPVLLGPLWSHKAMVDARGLRREREGQGEILVVIALKASDDEGEGLAQLPALLG